MKFLFAQLITVSTFNGANRRNLLFVLRFLLVLLLLICIYSLLFHVIMATEGRDYTMITGIYWSLTVMTTLGFGDITFQSDLGMFFTLWVLISGVFCFMLLLPVTFLRFIFLPMVEAQKHSRILRKLPLDTKGHIIIVGSDENAQSISKHLVEHKLNPVLLVEDNQLALHLEEQGFKVVQGEVDVPATYVNLQAQQAAMVVALHDDMKNSNIISTVREVASTVKIITRVLSRESEDVLQLAGADQVYYFAQVLGAFLARRVFKNRTRANIIGRFEGFSVAEAPTNDMPFTGKTLGESDLRREYGINIIGIWQGHDYALAEADTVINENAVLLFAATDENFAKYDAQAKAAEIPDDKQVLILGGGTVGQAIAEKLSKRGTRFCIVEKNADLIPVGDPNYIHGNAASIDILKAAGIEKASTIMVTTHSDDVNVYLTIYCRKLRPNAQIISRANQDRNVASLYGVGANLVVSQARIMGVTIVNQILPGRVLMLTQGLNVFELPVPTSLVGKKLIDSSIRQVSSCNAVAVRSGGAVHVPPDPQMVLHQGDELVLIGSDQGESTFRQVFGA